MEHRITLETFMELREKSLRDVNLIELPKEELTRYWYVERTNEGTARIFTDAHAGLYDSRDEKDIKSIDTSFFDIFLVKII